MRYNYATENILHVDIKMSHVNFIVLHVDMFYLGGTSL